MPLFNICFMASKERVVGTGNFSLGEQTQSEPSALSIHKTASKSRLSPTREQEIVTMSSDYVSRIKN